LDKTKKLKSNLVNMLLVLTTIAALSALLLGFTYSKTKGPIEAVQLKRKIAAIKIVTPDFEGDPSDGMYKVKGYEGLELYPVSKNGKPAGTAIKTFSSKGFSGDIWIMIGLDDKAKFYNSAVLQHAETPGLGSKMKNEKFTKQFKGQSPGSFKFLVKKDGGDIDAITAATITSRAFCDAVQKAYDAFEKGKDNTARIVDK